MKLEELLPMIALAKKIAAQPKPIGTTNRHGDKRSEYSHINYHTLHFVHQ